MVCLMFRIPITLIFTYCISCPDAADLHGQAEEELPQWREEGLQGADQEGEGSVKASFQRC